MPVRSSRRRSLSRAALVVALLALAAGASGCAQVGDSMSSAFADPAKYELYDCKQLETERKGLANRAAEQEGLMAKARTGVGGAVISEMAYRNELIAIHGQQKFAEEAWRKGKCHETPPATPAATPTPAPTPAAKGSRSRSGLR
ncbi:twin-arginine translocation pathway signal [Bradyrhizobium macuxiense]|uniref:Twin-arginine translocation pathway signal n=1 Tax=Bradyrhizobium macuxiense TaxID=1755647 RepID=A0A120FL07_9BRAD|nr:twin-arginine translocation pathway signal [Bradyrhizobium macuxiense]KWV51482.1 twin-arginine translocation pathway signal [Bradyrhizobium macuxiense]